MRNFYTSQVPFHLKHLQDLRSQSATAVLSSLKQYLLITSDSQLKTYLEGIGFCGTVQVVHQASSYPYLSYS